MSFKGSIWALIFPVILIVGIRMGVCTPSEAGAYCIVYAIIIGVFVYEELTWEEVLVLPYYCGYGVLPRRYAAHHYVRPL